MGAACTLSEPAPLLPSAPPVPIATALTAPPAPSSDRASEETPPPSGRATELLDAWSLAAKEDGAACRATLKASGVTFRAFDDVEHPDKAGCGIPHPVLVNRGSTGIVYDPPIRVDCTFARALASVERIVQEEALDHLHSRIDRIVNLGAYACRPRNFRKGASLSAHAFGSALDIASFVPARGTPAIVLRDYPETATMSEAQANRRRFLHRTFARLRSEADLTYTIGPDFNAIHKNHFHLDRGGWQFWFLR